MAGTADKGAAHRWADSFLLLALFVAFYKVQVHYKGAVRGSLLLCGLFVERRRIQHVYCSFHSLCFT